MTSYFEADCFVLFDFEIEILKQLYGQLEHEFEAGKLIDEWFDPVDKLELSQIAGIKDHIHGTLKDLNSPRMCLSRLLSKQPSLWYKVSPLLSKKCILLDGLFLERDCLETVLEFNQITECKAPQFDDLEPVPLTPFFSPYGWQYNAKSIEIVLANYPHSSDGRPIFAIDGKRFSYSIDQAISSFYCFFYSGG